MVFYWSDISWLVVQEASGFDVSNMVVSFGGGLFADCAGYVRFGGGDGGVFAGGVAGRVAGGGGGDYGGGSGARVRGDGAVRGQVH